ncbi:MAG: eL32 family ribosomal protein [Candidatus Pacearchaeota archaeon]|jgi:large subunit ribosomal protein L32e
MTRYNFVRRNTTQYLRLGKKRNKSKRWQKPKGRDNKMRLKFKGYPKTVSIGYAKSSNIRGKIEDKLPVTIRNVKDLMKVKTENIAVLGRVGGKKKLEIVKKAKEMKIEIFNVNIERTLKRAKKPEVKKVEVKKP